MTAIDFKRDWVTANAAAGFIMMIGAVNWALPFGIYLKTLMILVMTANVFIVPALMVKHHYAAHCSTRTSARIIAGGCVAYALVRSLFGITAAPWTLGTLFAHTVLVPLATAAAYFVLLTGMLLLAERRASA